MKYSTCFLVILASILVAEIQADTICGGVSIDTVTHACCSGEPVIYDNTRTCDGKCYDISKKQCCRNKQPETLIGLAESCDRCGDKSECGSTNCFDKQTEACCTGNIVKSLSSYRQCVDESCVMYDSENKATCPEDNGGTSGGTSGGSSGVSSQAKCLPGLEKCGAICINPGHYVCCDNQMKSRSVYQQCGKNKCFRHDEVDKFCWLENKEIIMNSVASVCDDKKVIAAMCSPEDCKSELLTCAGNCLPEGNYHCCQVNGKEVLRLKSDFAKCPSGACRNYGNWQETCENL